MSMDDLPTCMYECEPTDEKLAVIPAEKDINSATKHYFNCYDVKVVKNIELRSEKDGGSTKHIEVDLSKAKAIGSVKSESISYVTADNSAVLPVNNVELVKVSERSEGAASISQRRIPHLKNFWTNPLFRLAAARRLQARFQARGQLQARSEQEC